MALGGICAAIVINAIVGQTGRHPAPIVVTKANHVPGMIAEALKDPVTAKVALAQFPRPANVVPESRRHAVVSSIQTQLSEIGKYDGDVDGLVGPKTREAIAAYQRAHDLPVDGEATEELLDHIRFNRRIAEIAKPAAADPKVRLVQSGLSELGYEPGPVDGIMGDQTRDAIRQFERHRRLPESGEISERLIEELRKVTGLSVLSALESAQ
jgi:peptidoglycan hydrolase-like protein with peptidoglycan-binding domain